MARLLETILVVGTAGAAVFGAQPLHAAAPYDAAIALDGEVVTVRSASVQSRSLPGKLPSAQLDMEFEFSVTNAPMMRWAQQATRQRAAPKSGVVHRLAPSNEIIASQGFESAKVTRIAFPGLDAAGTAVATVALDADATAIRVKKALGSVARPRVKQPLVKHYRFELGPLPCARVHSVSPIVWDGRRWSDIRVTLGMQDIKAWEDWQRAFLLGEGEALNGQVTVLMPDLKTEAARLKLEETTLLSLQTVQGSAPPQFEVKLRPKTATLH